MNGFYGSGMAVRLPFGGPPALPINEGHSWLLEGFQRALWQEPARTAPLGALVEAGYLALFSQGSCCQATRCAYLILGDPLTPVGLRVSDAMQYIYLPLVSR